MNRLAPSKYSRPSLRLLFVPVMATVLLAPLSAWPCVFMCPGLSLVAPENGAQDIPLNARIWFGEEERLGPAWNVRLHDTVADVDIPLKAALVTSGSVNVRVYTPEHLLAAGTRYETRYEMQTALGGSQSQVIEFTTGSTEDNTPPPVPGVLSESFVSKTDHSWSKSDCGDASVYGATYSVTSEGIITVAGRPDQVPVEFGDATVDDISRSASGPASFFVGSGHLCDGSFAAPGSNTTVRFGAYDLAGNFSSFSDPLPVKVPAPSCGCASGSEAGSALLIGLGLLGRRRRVS